MLDRVCELLKQIPEEENYKISEDFKFEDVKKLIYNGTVLSVLNDFKLMVEKDLNIPNAFPYLHSIIKEKSIPARELVKAIEVMDMIFGLNIVKEAKTLLAEKQSANVGSMPEAEIEELIKERNQAKMEKNYAKADEIREMLKTHGIFLMDSPNGTTWKIGE